MKRTKKEIRETYNCELSMNRIEDRLILDAIDYLRDFYKGNKSVFSKKEIVDTAFEIQ